MERKKRARDEGAAAGTGAEVALKGMARLAASKPKRARAGPKAGPAAKGKAGGGGGSGGSGSGSRSGSRGGGGGGGGGAGAGAAAASAVHSGTRSTSRSGSTMASLSPAARERLVAVRRKAADVVLSPTRQAAGLRLATMLRGAVAARKRKVDADDMRLVLQNMRDRLVVSGKRVGRGVRGQRRLLDELLEEHAADLALDELAEILRSAGEYVSSRESASGLEADEARAVKQDVAMASLMFQGRANRRMDSKEREKLQSLARKLAPVAARSGDRLSAAARRIVALFGPNLSDGQVRNRLRSFLGSTGLRELDGILDSASRHASSVVGQAVGSASRSSEVARRARAAYLAPRAASGSRSGDEAAAGTSTRSFIAGASVGSLRSARADTRTSSRSARTLTRTSSRSRASQRSKVATPPKELLRVGVAVNRARRAAAGRVLQRYGVAEGAMLELTEIAKRFAKAVKAQQKGTGSPARLRKEMHDVRVEFALALLQSLPGRLDAEHRRQLGKVIDTVFAGRPKEARAAAIEMFSHKSAASALVRSEDKRRLRSMLAKLMNASELQSLQNEFDWISSVSRGSSKAKPTGPRSAQSLPAIYGSRLHSFSVDQSEVSSLLRPRVSSVRAISKLRELAAGARRQRRREMGKRSSATISTWLRRRSKKKTASA